MKKGKSTFTRAEANEILALIKQKLRTDSSKQKGIRAKIRKLGFYASDFDLRRGYTEKDFLNAVIITGHDNQQMTRSAPIQKKKQPINKAQVKRKDSDERYVIDLCDEVLGLIGYRQHRFDFLKGDSGTKLPVDVYYPSLNLVIEYRERQHTEPVKLFDQRMTVSGVSRGEQRRMYDQRRREVLPKHGIKLIEIGYDDFEFTSQKKIVRNKERDFAMLKLTLKNLKLSNE